MLAEEYFGFKKVLNDKGIVFSFCGYVSEGILFALGDALRQKMHIEATDSNTIKKVFSVFVELVQNIIRYSVERVEGAPALAGQKIELSSGVLAVGSEEGKFFVVCGNTVMAEDVASLKDKLGRLSQMSKEEMKSFYKEKLKEGPEAQSKGASIGLIEIARRASSPIVFDFLDLDEERSFFCLKAYI